MNSVPPNLGDILLDLFLTRKRKNPCFSLRAFAKSLNMSASHLSLLMQSKRALSEAMQEVVATKLRLKGSEKTIFELASRYERSRKKPQLAKKIEQEWAEMSAAQSAEVLTLSQRARKVVLERWECLAILEALSIPPLECEAKTLADRFQIDPLFAEIVLVRLQSVDLVSFNSGKWRRTSQSLRTGDIPDASIRHHHREYLQLAQDALEGQSTAERHITGCVFSCDSRLLPQAFTRIETFRRELMTFLETSQERDHVYRLSAQLFRLDKK